MKVTVLYGGPSAEREVSLVSGKAVINALQAAGHEVHGADINPADLSALDHPADVIFPVLHGVFGESGELQQILERRGLCFVGSGSRASRIGIDKARSKQAFEKAGLLTAEWKVLTYRQFDPAAGPVMPAPCVVKAIDSGSSIDVFVCKTDEQAIEACQRVLEHHSRALVERFITGTEVTVGILHEKALPPIRITTTREFFDFDAKYKGNFARHHFDLQLPPAVVAQVQDAALKAHQAVGCQDLSRVDMIVDADHRAWILEINTLPGFTPKSLLPEAAAQSGIDFTQLVDRLVQQAWTRHQQGKLVASAA